MYALYTYIKNISKHCINTYNYMYKKYIQLYIIIIYNYVQLYITIIYNYVQLFIIIQVHNASPQC